MPPRSGNPMATGCVACALELASWIYGAASFIVVSVTFPSICHLQILRLREFAAVFRKESEVIAVLGGHLRLRRQLRVHQPPLPGVFMDGDGDGDGEPICGGSGHHPPPLLRQPLQHRRARAGLDSACDWIGHMLTHRGKITHKAHASKRHVCVTVESFAIDISKSDSEFPVLNGDCDSDELECMEIVHPHGRTIFFQKRRAFVTYLENNGAGITIFMLEITLFLWLLGNTIWISRSHRSP